MSLQKTFLVKIFDQDGTTLQKVLTTDRPEVGSAMHLKNVPTYGERINGIQGEMVLDVKAPFDDFEEGISIEFVNIARVYAIVRDDSGSTPSQTSTLIYTGYISMYTPYIQEGGEEGVRVTLLGIGGLAALSTYGSSTAYSVTHTSDDPEDIGKAIIDSLNTNWGGSLFSYSGTTSAVGTNVTYVFTGLTHFDALKKTNELAGTEWWWKINQAGIYYLAEKPASATHRFTIGKDVVSLEVTKNSENVKNEVIIERSGGTRVAYTDATSQTTYGTGSPATGVRTKIITDTNISDATTSGQRGNKELNDTKDAKTSVRATINSKYSLESIHVGDTASFRHFKNASTVLSDNMQIVGLQYRGDTVDLEFEDARLDFGKALDSFVNG